MPPSNVAQKQEAAKQLIIFSGFETMDTQSARQALPNTRLAWCENLQIVGPNQLVCCNGPATPIATIPEQVSSQYFANFTPPGGVNTDFVISFAASGAAYQTIIPSGVTTKFANAGTFSAAPDMTVWSSQRILIADPVGGYATWDGHVLVQSGGVSPNIVITNGGSGYVSPPTVTISGGSGSGATAHAVITGGIVTSIILDSAGSGYKAGDVLTVAFSPASTTAATAIVWPFFGLTPTTLAVYAGRVWLAGARILVWTGTAGFDDAKAADASGSTTLTDADLVHQITALRALNNFLYIFGDASIKQIGTITVNVSSTIFNIVTLSSDQGTPFPRAIASYNRLILFANKVGVYAILGASVEKVSDPMDGIFSSIDYTQPLVAAVQDLHTSLHTFLILCRYKDPIALITRSLILCFYKDRWFVANQGNSLITFCTCPVQGLIETFGSSGTDVTQLFQSTTPVPIILRTSLSANGQIHIGKKGLRAFIAFFTNLSALVTGSADSEVLNPGVPFSFNTSVPIQWVNNANQPIQWQNNALQPVNWVGVGFIYQRIGQKDFNANGVFLGMTISGSFSGGTGGGGTSGASTGLTITALGIEYQDQAEFANKMSA